MYFTLGDQLLILSSTPKQRTSHSSFSDKSTGNDSQEAPMKRSLRKKSLSLYASGYPSEFLVSGWVVHMMAFSLLTKLRTSSEDPRWYTCPYSGRSSSKGWPA